LTVLDYYRRVSMVLRIDPVRPEAWRGTGESRIISPDGFSGRVTTKTGVKPLLTTVI
jgi:hypothetical protein